MVGKFKLASSAGFTLIEAAVTIGIVGVMSFFLLVLYRGNSGPERFSGEVHEFANVLREAQTKSFSVETGECPNSQDCFWRGNVLDFTTGGAPYRFGLLYGDDLSQLRQSDQKLGIKGKLDKKVYDLQDKGFSLTFASENTDGRCLNSPEAVSLAFLAPDGRAYLRCSSSPSATVNYGDQQVLREGAYTSQAKITFVLRAEGSKLIGRVTFDPANGSIATEIQ